MQSIKGFKFFIIQNICLLIIQQANWVIQCSKHQILSNLDWDGRCGILNNFRNKEDEVKFSDFKSRLSISSTGRSYMRERIKNEAIQIRLNVVYDPSIESEHRNYPGGIEKFVSDYIYSAQLIYEQPEINTEVKLNFVVVSLRRSTTKFERSWNVHKILETFSASSDAIHLTADGDVDLNLLLVFRNLWEAYWNPKTGRGLQAKILGLAYVGVFCRPSEFNSMIMNAYSLGSSIVLAHEMAHSLNVKHDGDGTIESSCGNDSNIMSPWMGYNKLTWSHCSVAKIVEYFTSQEISSCLYDPHRIETARPISEMFDFSQKPEGNLNRTPLPGQSIPVDQQCSIFFEKNSKSELTAEGRSRAPYNTCQNLVCIVDSLMRASIGPAAPGSNCELDNSTDKLGICFNSQCVIN